MRLDYALVEWAAEQIQLPRTPTWSYPVLSDFLGAQVAVKHENVQPTGAFKVRGGKALLAGLPRQALSRGLTSASTGNHATSIAYAAGLRRVPATIVVPQTAPVSKVAAVRALGAKVEVFGANLSESARRAKELATETGAYFVNPGEEPAIVAGHGTVYLELLQQYPDVEALYVPIGSGSGAAGACLVRDAIAPKCRIIGVQAAEAPSAYESWRSGELQSAKCQTWASGLATAEGFGLPQEILAKGLDDFMLVSEEELLEAACLMATHAHTLAEGAGAAGLAGLLADEARPKKIGFACTGGNAEPQVLAALSSSSQAA